MSDSALEKVQPVLVVLVWRGGERFKRVLNSLTSAESYFKRVIISITSETNSSDMTIAAQYLDDRSRAGNPSKIEIICSGVELPTMKHQRFWIEYLEGTNITPSDWIYWLAYDDELLVDGIRRLVDDAGNWDLNLNCSYFGPWAMRHEGPNELWSGDPSLPLEVWTSLPPGTGYRCSITKWIQYQLRTPTYIQMSGSVLPLEAHARLIRNFPRKHWPMRIELASAVVSGRRNVAEFDFPTVIIYGRSDSDRANYSNRRRLDDWHLFALIARAVGTSPTNLVGYTMAIASAAQSFLSRAARLSKPLSESWVVRDTFKP